MRMTILILAMLTVVSMAAVTRGSAHYSDASDVSALISNSYSSYTYEVNIEYQAGVGYNYHILWDSSSDDAGSASQFVASVIAAAIISRDTSWSSGYVVVGFMSSVTAWELPTSTARYILNNYDSRGPAWAKTYLFNNMVQIL